MSLSFPPSKMPDTDKTILEKKMRISFLIEIAQEVRDEITARISKKYSPHEVEEIKKEYEIKEGIFWPIVNYYFDVLLKNYKERHDYNHGKLAGRDKMAAFMAVAILLCRPFRSSTGNCSLVSTRLANELFALRYAHIVLHIKKQNGYKAPHQRAALDIKSEKDNEEIANKYVVHPIVMKNLLVSFGRLSVLLRNKFANNQEIQSTDPMIDWVINTMLMFALAYGRIDLRLNEGD